MSLEMKEKCGSCEAALEQDGEAYICSHECTYCGDCAGNTHNMTCPNCGGELQRRPRRNMPDGA